MVANDPVDKNNFSYTDPNNGAQKTSLSPERLAANVAGAGGNREKAVCLYTWYTAVSAALYGPVKGLEIALRNPVHRKLSSRYGPDWYDNLKSGLDGGTLSRGSTARADLKRESYPDDPPHVVAVLSIGFWIALLGPGGRLPFGGKVNYEMTLWRAGLFRAFPYAKISGNTAHKPLDYLRTFRSRIAHHEPIFDRHLARDFASLMQVTGWNSKDTQAWIAHLSCVPAVLAQAQHDAAIMF